MYLSRFGVKNYKCLGEIDIPLTPIHVLIGQNDCGKTSLLEAMAAFFATSDKPPAEVFPMPWKGCELVRHASPEPQIDFWGEWEQRANEIPPATFERLRHGFSVSFALKDNFCQVGNHWIETQTNGQKRMARLIGGPIGRTLLPMWKEGEELREPQLPKEFSVDTMMALLGVLKPAHQYALNAKLMAMPAALDPARRFRLDSDGFGLPTLLNDILGFSPETFLRLRSDFCRYFPQFKSFQISTETGFQRQCVPGPLGPGPSGPSRTPGMAIFFETVAGQTIRAQQASDGAILFLGFLSLAYLPDPPKLLLIEEPENGIYPARLRQIIDLLKQLVNRTEGIRFPQIILTTHSPYVLSFFQPEEVTLLSRPPDAPDAPVRARPLRDAPNIRERMAEDELYLGELWYNFTEKDLFGDS